MGFFFKQDGKDSKECRNKTPIPAKDVLDELHTLHKKTTTTLWTLSFGTYTEGGTRRPYSLVVGLAPEVVLDAPFIQRLIYSGYYLIQYETRKQNRWFWVRSKEREQAMKILNQMPAPIIERTMRILLQYPHTMLQACNNNEANGYCQVRMCNAKCPLRPHVAISFCQYWGCVFEETEEGMRQVYECPHHSLFDELLEEHWQFFANRNSCEPPVGWWYYPSRSEQRAHRQYALGEYKPPRRKRPKKDTAPVQKPSPYLPIDPRVGAHLLQSAPLMPRDKHAPPPPMTAALAEKIAKMEINLETLAQTKKPTTKEPSDQ